MRPVCEEICARSNYLNCSTCRRACRIPTRFRRKVYNIYRSESRRSTEGYCASSSAQLYDKFGDYFRNRDEDATRLTFVEILCLVTFSSRRASSDSSRGRAIVEQLAARQLSCDVSSRMPIRCSLSRTSLAAPRLSMMSLSRFFSVLATFWFCDADANWPVRGSGIIVVSPRLRGSGSPPLEDSLLRPEMLPPPSLPPPLSPSPPPLAGWSRFSPGISSRLEFSLLEQHSLAQAISTLAFRRMDAH